MLKFLHQATVNNIGDISVLGIISVSFTSLPGGAGRPKFNQLEVVTTFTYKPSFGEDRCTQFRVIVVTDPHTHKYTHTATNPQTSLITIYCATASVQCKYVYPTGLDVSQEPTRLGVAKLRKLAVMGWDSPAELIGLCVFLAHQLISIKP